MHLHKCKVKYYDRPIWCGMIFFTQVVIHQLFTAERIGRPPFWNPLPRVHLGISNVCNFLINEQKHKVWVLVFLIRPQGTFGTKFNMFFYNFSFLSPSSSCSRGGRQKRYATPSHIYDVKSADNRWVFLSNTFKKRKNCGKNDILIIFDSDSGPLPGFTQIQNQCKSSSTWVNYGGWWYGIRKR